MMNLFKKLKFTKAVALVTAVCFSVSIFTTSGFAAPVAAVMPQAQNVNLAPSLNPANFVIPFNIGRVTDSVNFKSGRVVVQIQDLHAHAETQRNIASILSMLDSKYKVKNIYVEGAFGQVNTGWIGGINDASVVENMVDKGVLSGAEYYSVKSGKPQILKGIENRKIYLENFNRLVQIEAQKGEIKNAFPEIRNILSYLTSQAYGRENKKIDNVVKKYKAGKISFEKYFSFIAKKAKKQDVYFGFYPSITLLADIVNTQNKLNRNKINSQLADFVNDLKAEISFAEYKELMDYSAAAETEGIFYFRIAELYNKGGYSGKYPELAKFFHFISLNQAINPLDLVSEERALLWEVKSNASVSDREEELVFLSNFIDLMEGFLDNKISAPEYKYFERELPRFKNVWAKYTGMQELPNIEQYYSLFEGFHKANIERNNIFVKEITGALPKTDNANIIFSKDMVMTDAAGLLAGAKEIDIVITGGFHTQDVSLVLQNMKQSYVVITPNVTQDTKLSELLYSDSVARISKFIPANAFKDLLASEAFKVANNPQQALNVLAGTALSKTVLDRFADENGGFVLYDDINNFVRNNPELQKELKNKGIENLSVSNAKATENGNYELTFKYDDAAKKQFAEDTYKITQQGAYNLKNAAQYDAEKIEKSSGANLVIETAAITGFAIGALIFAIAGMQFFALGAIAAIAGNFMAIGFSLASHGNAKYVQNALTQANRYVKFVKQYGNDQQLQNEKDRFIAELKNTYAGKIGEIRDDADLDTIAEVRGGVIYVNAIALKFLNEHHRNVVKNILVNHEMTHVKGIKSEFIANLRTSISYANIANIFYKFVESNAEIALLNFTKALNNYNAMKEIITRDGFRLVAMLDVLEAIENMLPYIESDEQAFTSVTGDMIREVLIDLEKSGMRNLIENPIVFDMALKHRDDLYTERRMFSKKPYEKIDYGKFNLHRSQQDTERLYASLVERYGISRFEESVANLRLAVSAYNANKTKENFAAAEAALEAIEFDVNNETMEALEAQVAEVSAVIEQMYGVSREEQIQQVAMVQEYIRGIKEGHSVDVESFLADENLDGNIIIRNYQGRVMKLADIDSKYGTPEYLKDISVAFNLGLAGIGESLDRIEFLKAWYVLQIRQGEAKNAAEKEAISKAVENGGFLKSEWYKADYEKLVNDKALQKKYGLDITTADNPRFKTKAGDPQLKTKALDIGLRVRGMDGYWTIKSVAEIILDDFIAKRNAGFAGLTLNLLTNAESFEDVKALLKKKAYTGKTYGEELVNLGVLKKVYGEDYKGHANTSGLYLQNTHPTIQYNKATGKARFFGFQQLINHGSFFAKLFRQMAESKDSQDGYWFFGNTDNFEAGQVPAKLFGWMSDTKTPAVIIVTEKGTSEGNKKGGIPTIVGTVISAVGTVVPIYKIVEIAQVKNNEVLGEKFQSAQNAFFNTNMVVASKNEVLSAIAKLETALDDAKAVNAINKAYPLKNLDSKEKIMDYLYVLGDLIVNNKKTSAGEEYVKLEIAIASSMMELNNLVSLATGGTMLKFVFLNDEEAKAMFGPIKNLKNFTETFENAKIIMNADGTQQIEFSGEPAVKQTGALPVDIQLFASSARSAEQAAIEKSVKALNKFKQNNLKAVSKNQVKILADTLIVLDEVEKYLAASDKNNSVQFEKDAYFIMTVLSSVMALPALNVSIEGINSKEARDLIWEKAAAVWNEISEITDARRLDLIKAHIDSLSNSDKESLFKRLRAGNDLIIENGKVVERNLTPEKYSYYSGAIVNTYITREILSKLVIEVPVNFADNKITVNDKAIGVSSEAVMKTALKWAQKQPDAKREAYAKGAAGKLKLLTDFQKELNNAPDGRYLEELSFLNKEDKDKLNSLDALRKSDLAVYNKASAELNQKIANGMEVIMLSIDTMKARENWEMIKAEIASSDRSHYVELKNYLGLSDMPIMEFAARISCFNFPPETITVDSLKSVESAGSKKQIEKGKKTITDRKVLLKPLAGGMASRYRTAAKWFVEVGLKLAEKVAGPRAAAVLWGGKKTAISATSEQVSDMNNPFGLVVSGPSARIAVEEYYKGMAASESGNFVKPDLFLQNTSKALNIKDGKSEWKSGVVLGHGNIAGDFDGVLNAVLEGSIFGLSASADNPMVDLNSAEVQRVIGYMQENALLHGAITNERALGQSGGGPITQEGYPNIIDTPVSNGSIKMPGFSTFVLVTNYIGQIYAVSQGIKIGKEDLITWNEYLKITGGSAEALAKFTKKLSKLSEADKMTMRIRNSDLLPSEFVEKKQPDGSVNIQFEQISGMNHGALPKAVNARQAAEGIAITPASDMTAIFQGISANKYSMLKKAGIGNIPNPLFVEVKTPWQEYPTYNLMKSVFEEKAEVKRKSLSGKKESAAVRVPTSESYEMRNLADSIYDNKPERLVEALSKYYASGEKNDSAVWELVSAYAGDFGITVTRSNMPMFVRYASQIANAPQILDPEEYFDYTGLLDQGIPAGPIKGGYYGSIDEDEDTLALEDFKWEDVDPATAYGKGIVRMLMPDIGAFKNPKEAEMSFEIITGLFNDKNYGALNRLYSLINDDAAKIAFLNDIANKKERTIFTSFAEFFNAFISAVANVFGINTSETFISDIYPELAGKEDVIILGSFANDIQFMSNARIKAGLGKNVNIIMPFDNESVIEAYPVVNSNGSGAIYKRTIPQDNGFSVNIYYYKRNKAANETDKEKALNVQQAVYNVFEFVKNDIAGEIGLVENDSNNGAARWALEAAAPLSYVINIEEEDGLLFTVARNGGLTSYEEYEGGRLQMTDQILREKRNGDNMRNQPRTFTSLDLSKIGTSGILNLVSEAGANTVLLKLGSDVLPGDLDGIKKFIDEAHNKNIQVVVEFKAENARNAVQLVHNIAFSGILRNLVVKSKKIKAENERGIDGVILDFDALSEKDLREVVEIESWSRLDLAVKRENVDGMLGVRTKFYNNYAFAKNGVKNAAKWVEFSTQEGEFNQNTMDVNELSENMMNAVSEGAEAVGMSLSLIEVMKKNGVNFSFSVFMRGIVSKWVSLIKNTPEGKNRSGHRSGLAERDIKLEERAENNLYKLLGKMRSSDPALVEHIRQLNAILNTPKTNQLVAEMLNTDRNEELIYAEAQGYLQGVLENMQASQYMQNAKFAISTDAAIYRAMLVEAKLYIVANDINVSSSGKYASPYIDALLARSDTNNNRYEGSNAEMQQLVGIGSSFEGILNSAPARSTINTLAYLVENDKLSENNRPIAIANLIVMFDAIGRETKIKIEPIKMTRNEATLAILRAA